MIEEAEQRRINWLRFTDYRKYLIEKSLWTVIE